MSKPLTEWDWNDGTNVGYLIPRCACCGRKHSTWTLAKKCCAAHKKEAAS